LVIRHPDEGEEYDTTERCRILEIWNRADDPAVSIARARVAPGVTTRLHRLAGIAERYLILSGRGQIDIAGESARVVVPGDLVYIPPDCPQRIHNPGPGELIFLALCTPRFVPEAYLDIDPDD